ncbi:MAG: hypothetical protein RIS26_745 [Actinomycetota bacterium]|jgi:branched-subunit amino acid transport protein AzlD
MNLWLGVILGSIAVYSWKLLGYLVPKHLLENKVLQKLSGFLTITLLAGLVSVQTFADQKSLVIDERLLSLLVAAVLLKFKAPFIVVVIAAGAVAAIFRAVF